MKKVICSVFTKPWPRLSLDELGSLVSGLGFQGIEFPVRPGFQVEPQDAEKGLPQAAEKLAAYDVKITSVAGELSEPFFAGCQAAQVPLIRIMANFKGANNYLEAETEMRRVLDGIQPLCAKYGVQVGVQHHYGSGVSASMELRRLLEGFDRKYIGAIWDAAHAGLAGEDAAKGLGIVWDYLCLVNLKAAYYKRVNGPEAEDAKFKPYFTTARMGNINWEQAISFCHENGYAGIYCFPAEYTDEKGVLEYITKDIAYARSLFEKIYQ